MCSSCELESNGNGVIHGTKSLAGYCVLRQSPLYCFLAVLKCLEGRCLFWYRPVGFVSASAHGIYLCTIGLLPNNCHLVRYACASLVLQDEAEQTALFVVVEGSFLGNNP